MSERKDSDHHDVNAELYSLSTDVAITLTAEDRAVLLECRRHALFRGTAAGGAVCSVVYWLKAQGRVPVYFHRYSGATYSILFFGAFLWGAGSYQKKCFKKIMSLENSVLAERIRKVMKTSEERKVSIRNRMEAGKMRETPPTPPSSGDTLSSTDPSHMPKLRPHIATPPSSTEFDKEPSSYTSSDDGPVLVATPDQEKEQPNAFSKDPKTSIFYEPLQDKPQRGRTFEEIRQESRRKQYQSSYPTSQSSSSTAPPAVVPRKRRNKFGDDIEE